jgi:hypothetical protein
MPERPREVLILAVAVEERNLRSQSVDSDDIFAMLHLHVLALRAKWAHLVAWLTHSIEKLKQKLRGLARAR